MAYRDSDTCPLTQLTAASGTAVTGLIPPKTANYARITSIRFRCGATPHDVVLLKALGNGTTLNGAVAASGTSVTLTADPGTGTPAGAIANADWVCIQLDDSGSYFLTVVASLSTLTFTSGAFPSAAASGNRVWFFGAPADHLSSQTNPKVNPKVGSKITATVSVLNTWEADAGLVRTLQAGDPLMVYNANATNASTFEQVIGVYSTN